MRSFHYTQTLTLICHCVFGVGNNANINFVFNVKYLMHMDSLEPSFCDIIIVILILLCLEEA